MNPQGNVTDIQNQIGQYEQFLKVDPQNPQLLINLGDLYHKISDFNKAVDCYQQSLELDDSDIAKGRLASIKITQHQFNEAEAILTELRHEDSDDPTLLFNLGLSQYYQEKWQEAEHNFRTALDKGADSARCYFYITRCLHHQHNFDDAKAICHDWVTLSQSTEARGYLALLEMDSGQSEKACEIAYEVLKDDPDNTDAGIVIGISDVEEQDIEGAVKRFEKVLFNDATHPRALFGLGLTHLHQQRHAQAIKLMDNAARQMPKDTGIKITIGWAKTSQQDFKGAEAEFREVIRLDRNFSEGYGGLAYILALQGKLAEAKEAMQRAQWLDPGSFGAAASQSVILGIEKGTDDAIEYLSNALEMPPAPGQKPIIEHVRTYLKKYGPKQNERVLEDKS